MTESEKKLRAASGVVLVIDDNDAARATMVKLLIGAGLRVVDLPSPIGATRAAAAHEVHAVVIDVYMPGMRGERLGALFRDNPRFRDVGVVLVSAESEPVLHRLLAETGADAVVSKAELDQLVPAVRSVLQQRLRRG